MRIITEIRPVSDLQNNFNDISRLVHENGASVILTKNGRRDMVVMSVEAYENSGFQSEIYHKLKEAEIEADSTEKRYTHGEVMDRLQKIIAGA